MRIIFLAFSFGFLCILPQVLAQPEAVEQREAIIRLLDSSDYYGLKDAEKSLQFSKKVLAEFSRQGNDSLHVEAMLNVANSLKMLNRKEEALEYARQAITIATSLSNRELEVKSYFMKGSVFGQDDEQDSTLVAYQKVIDLHFPGMNPYFVSSAYGSIGRIYNAIGNDKKAESYLLKAYELSSGDDYSKIFTMAALISFYVDNDDPKYLPYLDSLEQTDFYKNASPESFMSHFETFLLLDESSDTEKEKTLSEVYAYSKNHSSLVNQVGYGKKLYQHYQQTKQFNKAQPLLHELLNKAIASGNGVYTLGITRALYDNSKALGNLSQALTYLENYNTINDSLLSLENTNRIAELNIRFETAQKDHEIEQQKIRLEQERRNRNFFIVAAILLSALAITVFFYFRNRTRSAKRIAARDKVIHLQETEKLIKEKEVAELTATLETQERERNRIARDLHDGLGSTMSGISSQIEYMKAQATTPIYVKDHLSQLKDLVKEVSAELRRTSYELMPAKLLRQGLEPAIRDLCLNLLVKKGIEPSLEINDDLSSLNPEQQLTLYRIIQELFNNIVKHAEAKNVLIQFTRFENELSLVVEDDGKGFDIESKKQDGGLGLGSLGSRVSLLKGFLDIASTVGEGTTVTINFPVK